jgi:cell filamentation protein
MGILFAETNRIHPFREGNGRAQRQFVRQLSNSVGYRFHFEVDSKERLVQASTLSANGNVDMMLRLMDEITDTERIQPLAKVIDHLKRNDFKWNDVYLATTTAIHDRMPVILDPDGYDFRRVLPTGVMFHFHLRIGSHLSAFYQGDVKSQKSGSEQSY